VCCGTRITSRRGLQEHTSPKKGTSFERVDMQLVGALLGKAANESAPEDDQISAGIIKVFWQRAQQRIAQIVRACIRLSHHPRIWKTAKGVVISKPGKPDYSKVRAYRVISLLDATSKLLVRTAAHLISDHLERKRGLHEGQYGCLKHRSCINVSSSRNNLFPQEKVVASGGWERWEPHGGGIAWRSAYSL